MKFTKEVVFSDEFEKASYNKINDGLYDEIKEHERAMVDAITSSLSNQLPKMKLSDTNGNALMDAFKQQLTNNFEKYQDQVFQLDLADAIKDSKNKLDGYNHPAFPDAVNSLKDEDRLATLAAVEEEKQRYKDLQDPTSEAYQEEKKKSNENAASTIPRDAKKLARAFKIVQGDAIGHKRKVIKLSGIEGVEKDHILGVRMNMHTRTNYVSREKNPDQEKLKEAIALLVYNVLIMEAISNHSVVTARSYVENYNLQAIEKGISLIGMIPHPVTRSIALVGGVYIGLKKESWQDVANTVANTTIKFSKLKVGAVENVVKRGLENTRLPRAVIDKAASGAAGTVAKSPASKGVNTVLSKAEYEQVSPTGATADDNGMVDIAGMIDVVEKKVNALYDEAIDDIVGGEEKKEAETNE